MAVSNLLHQHMGLFLLEISKLEKAMKEYSFNQSCLLHHILILQINMKKKTQICQIMLFMALD